MAQTALDRVKAALENKTPGIVQDGASETFQLVEVDSADIAALTGTARKMEFADFVKANGLDGPKLTDAQRAALTKAHAQDGRTQIVRDLEHGQRFHKLYTNPARRRVHIKVDDALHLIDQQQPPAA